MVGEGHWEREEGVEDYEVDVVAQVGPGAEEEDEVGDYERRFDVV